MTTARGTILLVEDDAPQRRTLAGFLRKRGHTIVEAGSAGEALSAAATADIDLLVTDLRLGGPDGIAVLEALRPRHPDLQALVLTAYGTVEDAVRAMRAGAYDFLAKPVDLARLEVLIDKALERVRLAEENRGLRAVVGAAGAFAGLVGDSDALRAARDVAAKVAPTRATVLILGESGTGKEVLARAVHLASPRREQPFVAVNCAALPETLVESELFGHEKGAFTGATAARKGRFEHASGGTLFLDEIGDIPLPVQVKLLRVLQTGTIERLGAAEGRPVDVRILAATHRDLETEIRAGRFREDLYYRIHVVTVTMPALRERPTDIPLLVGHFLRKYADLHGGQITGVEPDVIERLLRWRFPGNVRELENWIERAVVLADGPTLTRADFPAQLFDDTRAAEPATGAGPAAGSLEDQVAALESRQLAAALERHGGNKSAAARDLGLTERGMRYKLRKYGLG